MQFKKGKFSNITEPTYHIQIFYFNYYSYQSQQIESDSTLWESVDVSITVTEIQLRKIRVLVF